MLFSKEISAGIVLAHANLLQKDLRLYCKQAWPLVDPTPVKWGKCCDAICDVLSAVTAGHIQFLTISISPRHGKSILSGVLWPSWEWASNPGQTWLYLGLNEGLAVKGSIQCRALIQSRWYQLRWPGTKISDVQSLQERYYTTARGHRCSGTLGGLATGDGGNRIIYDDPMKIEDRHSDSVRWQINDFWDNTLVNRVNDQATGARIIIAQRLMEDDLIGHLKDQGYTNLVLSQEYEEKYRCQIEVPGFKWADWRTTEGELLWPERFGRDIVDRIKKSVTPENYSSIYQQRPFVLGGNKFKREWHRDFVIRETAAGTEYLLLDNKGLPVKAVMAKDCHFYGAIDPASAKKQGGKSEPCFTVGMAFAQTPDFDLLLLEIYRAQSSTPETIDAMAGFIERNGLSFMLVEENGIGLPLIQGMQRRGLTVRGVSAIKNYIDRADAAVIRMSNGQIYFRKAAGWRAKLEFELEHFPSCDFVDQVDCLAHAAKEVADRAISRKRGGIGGVISFAGRHGAAVGSYR